MLCSADPLVREYLDGDSGSEDEGPGSGLTQNLQFKFDVTDDKALEQATELAAEAKSVRAYSALGGDARSHVHMLCGVCGTHVFSQMAAMDHAANTNHCDFQEIYDEEPVPPTGQAATASGPAPGGGK